MIVRDEAKMLPRFLKAAQGLYDELCVVDTGSSDATLSLLEAAGAKIKQVAWADDFSAARNESLAMATCTHILVLDADEIVSPAFVAECRALLQRPNLGAATVVMANSLAHGHRKQSQLLRLFRAVPEVRFAHRIHEDVTLPVIADLTANALVLGHIKAEIEHLGYSQERARERNKKERDTDLLWQCIGEDPADLYSWYKLLEQGQFWEDAELSEQAAEGIEQLLEEYDEVPIQLSHFFGPMVVALAIARTSYDAAGARQLVEHWCKRLPDDAALRLHRGQLREADGDFSGASEDYRHCLSLAHTTLDDQLVTTRPELGLARVAMAQARLEPALAHIERALARHPRDPEALLALASLGRALGGSQGANRIAQIYADAYGDVAEMHAAWGEAAMLSGQNDEAAARFAKACALEPDSQHYADKLEAARDGHDGHAR